LDLEIKNNEIALLSKSVSPTIDLDPSSNSFLMINTGSFDGLISEYDTSGNFLCGGSFTGIGQQNPSKLTVSNSNKITLIGSFQGVSDINPSASGTLLTNITNNSIIQLQPNHPAIALPDSATLTCSVDSIIIPCIANDSDTDECYQLLYFLDSVNSNYGTSYIDSFSGNLVYKAKPSNPCNTALVDTVWYKVADRQWLPFISKSFAVIHLNACACPNHAPSANPDSIITACNTSTTIYPKINDTDIDTGQHITITNLITTGLQGSAIYTDSTITFTPNAGYSGTTTLQYIICDNGSPSLCDTTTVTFSVSYCNHAPIAAADSFSFYCLDSLLIHPLGNDADADTFQQIHISAVLIAGLQGTAVYTDTSITFYPNTNFTGITTLQYIVCDNDTASLCDTASVTFFVAACNHAPIAANDVAIIACQDSIWLQPLSNDSDADSNQTISITNIFTYPSKGTIVKNGNAILYKALACKSGLDSFSYIICDNHTDAKCDTAVVYIQIATCGCEPPVANFSVILDTICTGKCVQVQDLSTNFTNAWSWTCIGANPSTSSLANPIFCFGNAGQYNITLIAANNFGSDTFSFVNAVTVVPSPTISISHDTNVAAGSSIALQCSGAVNYAWWPITGLSNPNGSSTMASIQQPISYLCTASDANNCTASAAVNIGIISQLVIPNAFSPNADGINDEFAIQLPPHTNYHLRIFNRWGNEIFTSTAIQNKWNGKYKNIDVPMETYFYTLTWVDAKNVEHIENGELTVVR
jgi:gliding motility-associated-like protein